MIFQSTFPRGERRWDSNLYQVKDRFQSTFPRGERHGVVGRDKTSDRFQSTFPRGERLKEREVNIDDLPISIHVPTRGTTANPKVLENGVVFQSTFPRGERR